MKKKILALALIAILAFAMCSCSKEPETIDGVYEDEVSQRAELSVYDNGDETYEIEIYWSNSSSETVYWIATGTFDGEVLSYDSGEKHVYTYDGEGEIKNDDLQASDLSGTLTLGKRGKLTWAGATEDESAVFTKIEIGDDE